MPGPTPFQPDSFQNIAVLGLPDAFQVGPDENATQPQVGGGGSGGLWEVAPLGVGWSPASGEEQEESILTLAEELSLSNDAWNSPSLNEKLNEKSEKKLKPAERPLNEELFLLFLSINHASFFRKSTSPSLWSYSVTCGKRASLMTMKYSITSSRRFA